MLEIIHQIITLLYSFIFYLSIISSCCRTKKSSNPSNLTSESPKINQEPEPLQTPKESGGKATPTSKSKEKSDKKLAKKQREKSISKKNGGELDLNRPGYSKSLIAIQEAALSQIFQNGSASDRKPDRTLAKNTTTTENQEKSELELKKTQTPSNE
ncbi:unnamed protein product [Caenorhabditis angaria]|uniref:Uncharacterized protein n=1 Tax=Caenorhabditis angaria TaxID=860376 RepID=A0A9P1ITN2_9PELO|nr:unnamed protein product [Caenorhabditis angaria]